MPQYKPGLENATKRKQSTFWLQNDVTKCNQSKPSTTLTRGCTMWTQRPLGIKYQPIRMPLICMVEIAVGHPNHRRQLQRIPLPCTTVSCGWSFCWCCDCLLSTCSTVNKFIFFLVLWIQMLANCPLTIQFCNIFSTLKHPLWAYNLRIHINSDSYSLNKQM